MKNLKDRDSAVTNGLMIVSILGLLGSLVFLLLPKPSSKSAAAAASTQMKDAQRKITLSRSNAAANQAQITTLTWSGPAQQVAPSALAQVNALAAKHKLRVVSFRPQRANEGSELVSIPFVVTVEGHFPDVVAFEREVEHPSTRLAVSMFQITSSDPNSDMTSASVGMLGFLMPAVNSDADATSKPAVMTGANRG